MSPKTRLSLIRLHTALAAFFLPMGLLYAITGGLYGLGVKGHYQTTESTVQLDTPGPAELSHYVALTERELAARNLDTPTGSAGIKKGGTSHYFEWTGSRRDVQIHPTGNPGEVKLKIMETNPHRFFVQLHKAKGGDGFKYFAGVWMVALVLLFLTGGLMAFSLPAQRKLASLSLAAGAACFAALAWMS